MQKSPHKPISTAFEQEFLASGDLEKAKEAAMMSWYDLPEKQKYAQHYAGLIKSAARAWRKNPSNFTQRFSAKEITDRLCVDNMGKSYVSTPEMLESKEKLNVNEKTGDKIASAAYRLINAYKRSRSELGFDQNYQKDNNNQYEKLSENALMKPYAYHHNPQPYHLKIRRER